MDPQAFSNWWKTAEQAAINFYGLVVDENTNALPGVTVVFSWREDREARKRTTTSDVNGMFSLQNQRGTILEVGVSKDGYYSPFPDFEGFSYAAWPRFSPDPINPIVFKLYKKGTPQPLIHLVGPMGGDRQYRLNTNGTPTEISFFTGMRSPKGQGQFKVEYSMEQPLDTNRRMFKWRCRITVPGGGLQAAPQEFPFNAPEDGYTETIEITSDPEFQRWSDRIQRSYFIRLPEAKFGWVKLNVICSESPYFGVEAFINPSGSRNLEYDQHLQGNITVGQEPP